MGRRGDEADDVLGHDATVVVRPGEAALGGTPFRVCADA
jgi:hypothetical protein